MSILRLRPGVNAELTATQNESGYSVSNLIRFRNGLAEKIGGWEKYYDFAVGGVPKALHAWLDLNENKYLGVGTTTLLGAIVDGQLTDLTPQQLTTNFTPDFSTTDGSPNVIIDDPDLTAGATNFDSVEFLTPVSVGGIILSGVYPIDANLGTTTYRIVADTNATATVANGGEVPTFTTTSGSATVNVDLNDHGLAVRDQVNFPISTTVGGIAISGTYTVTTIVGADDFEIATNTLATSSTSASMNSGEARLLYNIALGPVPASSGYSVGGYSEGGYSTGATPGQETGTPITATDWTLDNWGQVLLACPEGGGIYAWAPGTGLQNAQMIGAGPAHNTGVIVATEIQIAIAFGSDQDLAIGLDRDPLLVKWSNDGDYTDWEAGPTSQAGSRRLSTGSRIVGAMSAPQFNLLWTDIGVWNMNYIGFPDVFGFVPIGYGCGLIGKHAATRLGANIFWMSQSNFFMLGGGAPQVIPCAVWDTVFQDLNTANNPSTGRPYSDKSWAWANTPFNEVWFFFPRASTSATEPDFFVKYNTLENSWDYGPLDRTCGINQSILGMPIAGSSQSIIYQHEVGYDNDGQAINSYFETGDWQLSEGNDILFIDWILPDMKFETADGATDSASVLITFYSRYFPGDAQQTHGPFTFTSSTRYINTRIRGRLISMKIESADLGSWWRVGGVRMRGAVDGRL